jgi:hypothetical protein
VYVRPTGVNLTLMYGRSGPELIADLYRGRPTPNPASDLKREPVRDDFRAGVPIERRQCAVNR